MTNATKDNMKRTLIITCLTLTTFSMVFGQAAIIPPAVTRVVCLGDSLTYQEYPEPLNKLLGAGYKVLDYGVPSATAMKLGDVSFWNTGRIEMARKVTPQIVTILLGTNDARTQNWVHKDTFYADYKALIETVREFPSKPKIYLMIPPPVVDGKGKIDIKALREEITPMIEKLAKETGCGLIDLYAPLEKLPELSADGVHYKPAGDVVIAKVMYQALLGKPEASK